MALGGSTQTRPTIGNRLVNIIKRCGQGLPPKLRPLHDPGMLIHLSLTREQELPREPAALTTKAAKGGPQHKGRHPLVLKFVSRFIKKLPG